MTVKKNIAIWGLGKHSIKNIIPAIKMTENLKLVGCHTRDEKILAQISNEHNCHSWSSSEEMLMDNSIDIVYLSTPPGLHYLHGRSVLESNKHLWCEKPLSVSHQETISLINFSTEKGLSLFECFMYRHHEQFKKLKEIIKGGKLGKSKTINIKFGLPEMERPGFRFNPELGGSCLYDVGSYLASVLLELYPEGDFDINYSRLDRKDNRSIDVSGISLIEIDNSIDCFLDWSYNRAYQNNISIWLEQGVVTTNKIFSKDPDYSPKINLSDNSGKRTVIEVEQQNHFKLMLEYFLDSHEDEAQKEIERNRIERLSALLNKIVLSAH